MFFFNFLICMSITVGKKPLIIATIRTNIEEAKLKRYIDLGVNVFRLNMAHSKIEDVLNFHLRFKNLNLSIAVDTTTNELRVNAPNIKIKTGDILETKEFGFPVTPKKGEIIIFGDNAAEFKYEGDTMIATRNGFLKKGISVNFSSSKYFHIPYDEYKLTDQIKADYLFLSNTNGPDDVEIARKHCEKNIKIISKIETNLGIKNLDKISMISDGLMVARGDLMVEVGYTKLYNYQNKIFGYASKLPVICATQMLYTMCENPLPSRSEVIDISYAISNGCAGLMLSEETAVGKYPEECIRVMKDLIEEYFKSKKETKIKK